jgi:hypothetical protein
MDTHAMRLALEATEVRFEKTQERLLKDFGYFEAAEGVALRKAYGSRLTAYIEDQLSRVSRLHETNPRKGFLKAIEPIEPALLADTTLAGLGQSVVLEKSCLETEEFLGTMVFWELLRANLLIDDPGLAKRAERTARTRHGRLSYRKLCVPFSPGAATSRRPGPE